VIGADGRHSTVARLVAALEYLGYDGPRASYWRTGNGLTHGTQGLSTTSSRASTRAFCSRPTRTTCSSRRYRSPRALGRGATIRQRPYLADVRSSRTLGPLFGEARPLGRVRVLAKTRYFFRAAAGPGWALAGDAGHHKEFVIGLGISDALRDARSLATAVLEGTDAALERYWRRRDVERIEMYLWGRDVGEANAVNALERLVASARRTSRRSRADSETSSIAPFRPMN